MSAQKKLKKARAMMDAGKGKQALHLFKEVLEADPNQAEALYYMGVGAQQSGYADLAKQYFARAITSKPDYAAPYFRMGMINERQSDYNTALGFYFKALNLTPDNPQYVHSFAINVGRFRAKQENEKLLQAVSHILHHPNIEPDKLANAWFSLFRHSERYRKLEAAAALASPDAASINNAVNDPVTILGICYAQVRHVALEEMLTHLRKTILLGHMANDISVAFLAALALQNFHNEYIWDITPQEHDAIALLVEKISGNILTLPELFLLASYRQLGHIEGIEACRHLIKADSTGFGENIWQQQVTEPQEENRIKPTIHALTTIDDAISQAVQSQYEDNPYPRWKGLNYAPAIHFRDYIRQNFSFLPESISKTLPDSYHMLIAGCGTGRQALEAAKSFQSTTIEAVDLSRTSLAYAIRKKKELATNAPVKFAQADILRLGEAFKPESFDLIACSGVLHHMADPMAGWRVITTLLKPTGMMKIALYSKLARKAVIDMRAKIAEENIPSTPEGIRALRRQIKDDPKSENYKWLTSVADFYSMSDCRDLLFHVQEHQFTIPQIEKALEELGLEFLCFVGQSPKLNAGFSAMFPNALPGTLQQWDAYEQKNPYAFTGMYQFWVRKKPL